MLFTQVALPASFSVPPVDVVSPPLHDVMGSGHVLMEAMRWTAVSCTNLKSLTHQCRW